MTTESAEPGEGPKPMDAKAAKPAAADAESTLKPSAAQAKEAKAKAKADKAARRAAVKENRVAAPAPEAGAKAKAPQDGASKTAQGQTKMVFRSAGRRPSMMALEKEKARNTIPEIFSHIPMARRIPPSQASKDVHPAVLTVGQQMATFELRDNVSRLQATLLAFRKVIESYTTPKGNSLSRHFIPHVLNHQIEYLTECRPMCFSMGNAIRIIKARVNKFDIDTPEDEAKEELLDVIESFLSEKVTLAELLISRNAAKMVATGDVILTYRHGKLVEKTLLQAHQDGKDFEVVILDDPYDPSGQSLAKIFTSRGMRVSYYPHLGGLRQAVQRATIVMLGAEAFFANGTMYAACGSNDIALASKDAGRPTVVLCETINFDRERVAVDALTYNEIDPDRNSSECVRLLFDVTRAEDITGVITEHEGETAISPSEAILAILSRQDVTTRV